MGRKKHNRQMDLSEQLRAEFEATGWSIYRLAKEAGVGYPIVYGWIGGDRDLRLKSASAIARALGLRLTKGK